MSGRDIPPGLAHHDSRFQFKIEFLKMIRHTADGPGALYTVMVGKIEDRVLIKLGNHIRFTVSSCRSHVLAKRIAVAAGAGKGNRGHQRHIGIMRALVFGYLPLAYHDFSTLRHRQGIFPVIEEYTHIIR